MTTKEQRDEWQRLSDENQLDEWTVTEQAGDEDDKEATIWAGEGHLCIGDFYHAADAKTAAMARNALPALLQDIAALTANLDAEKARCAALVMSRDLAEQDRAVARSERDASNAAREQQWKELQAARADAKQAREAVLRVGRDPRWSAIYAWLDDHKDDHFKKIVDLNGELEIEVTRLREENAALKVSVDGARSEAERIANLVRPTRAALGRAHAALRTAAIYLDGYPEEMHTKTADEVLAIVRAVLADPEGRAAAEYIKRLEEEIVGHREECCEYPHPVGVRCTLCDACDAIAAVGGK